MDCDVAVIGGGPGGSSVAIYLKNHNPELKVAVFEREIFPRDHVGESQLPIISHYLQEMGLWDKIEAAKFPIKVGATFRWGTSDDLWYFDFLREEFKEEERPAPFEGQRKGVAFQVDRAVYDKILLDHAKEIGCEVFEGTKVVKIHKEGDKVTSLVLEDGTVVNARYYLDASGHVGILRKAMGVKAESPTSLQNVAFWDYWENAKWAETVGVSGTRVQVMSLGYGWIWFIPLGPTRVSVGLITPAKYYKDSGKRPEEMYAEALAAEPRIADLMVDAVSEGKFSTTKDWSFLAARLTGENWMLVGESAGFADPILAAGLTITHTSAREAAFTILEMDRGETDHEWLKSSYDRRLSKRILNHIRFADYWYTANTQFSELREFTKEIAKENGLEMDSEQSWRWLAQGGFIDEDMFIGNGGIALGGIRDFAEFLYGATPESPLSQNNVFKLDLDGAEYHERAKYVGGRVLKEAGYLRGKNLLPTSGVFFYWMEVLKRSDRLSDIMAMWGKIRQVHKDDAEFQKEVAPKMTSALEAMVFDGWVKASLDPSMPLIKVNFSHDTHRKVGAKDSK